MMRWVKACHHIEAHDQRHCMCKVKVLLAVLACPLPYTFITYYACGYSPQKLV